MRDFLPRPTQRHTSLSWNRLSGRASLRHRGTHTAGCLRVDPVISNVGLREESSTTSRRPTQPRGPRPQNAISPVQVRVHQVAVYLATVADVGLRSCPGPRCGPTLFRCCRPSVRATRSVSNAYLKSCSDHSPWCRCLRVADVRKAPKSTANDVGQEGIQPSPRPARAIPRHHSVRTSGRGLDSSQGS